MSHIDLAATLRRHDTEPPAPPGYLHETAVVAAPQDDEVNHPSHYTSHPSGVECIQVTEHMTFCAGNAIKYLWRAGLKHDGAPESARLRDLRKARWYVDREIERLLGVAK